MTPTNAQIANLAIKLYQADITSDQLDDISINVIKQLITQNEKGMETYGQSLSDCPVDDYDWQNMLVEELVDGLQYQQKEIMRLKRLLWLRSIK